MTAHPVLPTAFRVAAIASILPACFPTGSASCRTIKASSPIATPVSVCDRSGGQAKGTVTALPPHHHPAWGIVNLWIGIGKSWNILYVAKLFGVVILAFVLLLIPLGVTASPLGQTGAQTGAQAVIQTVAQDKRGMGTPRAQTAATASRPAPPAPSPSASTGTGSPTPAPVNPPVSGGMGLLLKPDPKPTATKVSDLKPEPRPSSLATVFLGADDWSRYTLSGPRPAFVDGEQRMSLPMAESSIALARILNGTARTLVAFTVWMTDQTVNFGIGQALIPLAKTIGQGLMSDVLGPIRLGDVALTLAITIIGWRAVTGRRAHAVRDTLIGIAVLGIGMVGMATPHGPICTSLNTIGGISRFFLALTTGLADTPIVDMCGATTGLTTSVFTQAKAGLFTAFVQEPFLALQWGELTDSCKRLALDIAQAGYFGDSPEPRHVMSSNGCEAAAHFNGSAGIDRAIYAGLHLLLVTGWALGMLTVLLPMMTAQGVAAVLLILAPVIWAVGVIPTTGHYLLMQWVMTGFKAAVGMVLSGALLAIILAASTTIAPSDQRLLAVFMPTVMVLSLAAIQWQSPKAPP